MRVRKQGVRGAHPKDIVKFAERNTPPGSRDAYVQVARAASVTVDFLVRLNELLMADAATSRRPVHRHASSLDTALTWVMLLPDVAFPDAALSIEIKPKHGLLPSAPGLHPVKQTACRFCMHQLLKQAQGKVVRASAYCPLDLFSNDKARIARALTSLSSTPQNNLRVFSSCTEAGDSLEHSAEHSMAADQLDLVVELLHSHVDLLDDLKAMHAKDTLDIEGVFALSQLHAAIVGFISCSESEQQVEDTAMPVSQTLGQVLPMLSTDLSRQLDMYMPHALLTNTDVNVELWTELTIGQFQTVYSHVLDSFLVATTFKDCSVLLSLRPVPSLVSITPPDAGCSSERQLQLSNGHHYHTATWNGQTYEVVVAIVDLDIKAHKPVAAYYAQDQGIVRHFASIQSTRSSANSLN
ncbi:hypothetical protein DYB28_007361 [Aphanomyces astaci]|uniref:Inositol-pentakisphosphate 2-kinase n=1 Tax=Aphanomyces astaci TaxID=112090 RepID=A0A9X8H5A9_APHAT|nr:hypothetical protein DYB28_007361 [Aphanomyces astaci]